MFYFPHLPKCGGTTIKQLFFSALGRENCIKIWNKNFGADFEPREFLRLEKAAFKFKTAIVGHLSFSQAISNNYVRALYEEGKLQTITIVRDPIDRRISLFNYMRSNEKHSYHSQILNIDPSTFIMSQPWNFQTEFLRAHDNETVESIFERMSIFPIENSEALVRKWLEVQTNKTLTPVPKANVTAKSYPDSVLFQRDSLTIDQISILKQRHNLDFHLYDRSKKSCTAVI